MICYRDMTLCASDCTNAKCRRYFSPDDKALAERWWGGPDAPVAWCDYSANCVDYTKPTDA